MMALYVKMGCPYVAKVKAAAAELGVAFDERDIADPVVAAELVARGGKRQVPYLLDSDRGVGMYESVAIEAYLRAQHTSGSDQARHPDRPQQTF